MKNVVWREQQNKGRGAFIDPRWRLYIYIYIYIVIYVCIYIYTYIYIERERDINDVCISI